MQKKILLIGSGPLPFEGEGIRNAGGLRTEQFLSPLTKGQYEVFSILIHSEALPKEQKEEDGSFRISRSDPFLFRQIRHKIKNFSPDICIAVNTFPSFVAAKTLPKETPFWADLNGWIMAEAQVRAGETGSNALIPNSWHQEKTVLLRADKVSTVSTPQRFATIGELASIGRIRKETNNYDFVTSIPNATKKFALDEELLPLREIRKEKGIPEGATVISFIGGYNNWVDEKSLFEGLEKAMARDEKVFFVSTGGNIDKIATGVFGRFQERIRQSKYKNRFVFLGWIATKDMASVYNASDIGISTDILCTETETGARNRINEMMKFGLPVITTSGSEIAERVAQYECGLVAASGNSDEIAEKILILSRDETLRKKYGENGKQIVENIFHEDLLFKPIEEFILSQKIAPDRALRALDMNGGILSFLKGAFSYGRQNGIPAFFKKIFQYFV
ncbi:MAG: glycosyltransferase family 4 protein [Candidatus Peregrinibacteria bacterium]